MSGSVITSISQCFILFIENSIRVLWILNEVSTCFIRVDCLEARLRMRGKECQGNLCYYNMWHG